MRRGRDAGTGIFGSKDHVGRAGGARRAKRERREEGCRRLQRLLGGVAGVLGLVGGGRCGAESIWAVAASFEEKGTGAGGHGVGWLIAGGLTQAPSKEGNEEEEEAGEVNLDGQGKREYACTGRRKKENQRHKEGSEASADAAALYYSMYAHDSPSADHEVGPGVAAPITPSADHAVGPGVRVRVVAFAKKLRKEGLE